MVTPDAPIGRAPSRWRDPPTAGLEQNCGKVTRRQRALWWMLKRSLVRVHRTPTREHDAGQLESIKRPLKCGLPVPVLSHAMQSWIGVNLDIQEHKLAEFYLAEGQRLAHMGNWTFSAAGFGHWSPELFAIHGLDPGSTPPSIRQYMALVHPDDREFVEQEIQTMLAECRGFDFTKRIVRPDGSVRHVRCFGTPATSSEEFQGFVGIEIDVTEHEELITALRKSEAE